MKDIDEMTLTELCEELPSFIIYEGKKFTLKIIHKIEGWDAWQIGYTYGRRKLFVSEWPCIYQGLQENLEFFRKNKHKLIKENQWNNTLSAQN